MAKDKLTPLNYCDGCRRESGTTVCGICWPCATKVIRQRRVLFPGSEGNTYMARRFGVGGNYFNVERDDGQGRAKTS